MRLVQTCTLLQAASALSRRHGLPAAAARRRLAPGRPAELELPAPHDATGPGHRLGEIDAAIRGGAYRTDDIGWQGYRALEAVAGHDPDLLRGWFRIAGMIASGLEVFGAPGFLARLSEVLVEHPIDGASPALSRGRPLELAGG